MKLYEHSFRDLYHQFIVLPIDKHNTETPVFFYRITPLQRGQRTSSLRLYRPRCGTHI